MLIHIIRKQFEPGRIYKVVIRKYHQFKPKDKIQAFDAPLPHDIQAQSKDILLFRYENPNKIFRNNIVALMIFPCYAWLSYFTYELRAELLPYKDSEVLDRKGSGWVYQATLFNATRWLGVVVFIFGTALSGYWISRSMNTVRRIVLRKGGKYVTIVTYGVLGYTSRYVTRHVSQCSAVRQKYQADQRMFLNVKGHRFRYQLNVKDGIFNNKPLFDRTVGISRNIR